MYYEQKDLLFLVRLALNANGKVSSGSGAHSQLMKCWEQTEVEGPGYLFDVLVQINKQQIVQ